MEYQSKASTLLAVAVTQPVLHHWNKPDVWLTAGANIAL
jgi:hypothetical protein